MKLFNTKTDVEIKVGDRVQTDTKLNVIIDSMNPELKLIKVRYDYSSLTSTQIIAETINAEWREDHNGFKFKVGDRLSHKCSPNLFALILARFLNVDTKASCYHVSFGKGRSVTIESAKLFETYFQLVPESPATPQIGP